MWMLALIVECGVPAEVLRRDVHGGGDVISVCMQERTPRLGIVITQVRGVLPVAVSYTHLGAILQFMYIFWMEPSARWM